MSVVSQRAKWGIGLACAGCATLVLALVVTLAWLRSPPTLDHVSFSSAAWRAVDRSGYHDDPTRRAMVDDLRARLLVPGTPRSDVLSWLGEPSGAWENQCRYELGLGRGMFGRRLYSLRIEFDDTWRVVRTVVTEIPE